MLTSDEIDRIATVLDRWFGWTSTRRRRSSRCIGPLAADLISAVARMTEDLERFEPSRREPLLAWLKAWKAPLA